ncbi:hypothetical protein ElyMa_005812000 [Elysia marginata]|uniref:Uncharacterized protein n=1 Tax=Elysia marginata TaxID=1093978 RepID=A0AAV4FX92_9GAST|nr:hypothetical protein ElyMa_005812000 [Elysia marginata]
MRNLTQGTEKCLSNNSANAKLFEEAASKYNAALKQNEHLRKLTFAENKSTVKTYNIALANLNKTSGKTSQRAKEKETGHKEKTNNMV